MNQVLCKLWKYFDCVDTENNVDVFAMVESKCTGTKLKKAESVVSIRFHFHCPAKSYGKILALSR